MDVLAAANSAGCLEWVMTSIDVLGYPVSSRALWTAARMGRLETMSMLIHLGAKATPLTKLFHSDYPDSSWFDHWEVTHFRLFRGEEIITTPLAKPSGRVPLQGTTHDLTLGDNRMEISGTRRDPSAYPSTPRI